MSSDLHSTNQCVMLLVPQEADKAVGEVFCLRNVVGTAKLIVFIASAKKVKVTLEIHAGKSVQELKSKKLKPVAFKKVQNFVVPVDKSTMHELGLRLDTIPYPYMLVKADCDGEGEKAVVGVGILAKRK